MSASRFSYTPHYQAPVGMPVVDVSLSHSSKSLTVTALIDSGAALNVLPFDVGLELGLVWETQNVPLEMGGVLAGTRAYAVLVQAEITTLPPVKLAFAWVNRPSTEIRTLLGQVNFFQEFDVHFYGHQQAFEISRSQ
jgi:hypothetical protein